jgi:predicted Fe-Mo cluster-binding NifX family protein
MKIAIPTNDGLLVIPEFSHFKGFLVVTLNLGEIISEEFREKTNGSPDRSYLTGIRDCGIVMARLIDAEERKRLEENGKKVVITRESIITRAIIEFINADLVRETNTCCCP